MDYENLHDEAISDKIGHLGVKPLKATIFPTRRFAPAFSDETPRLCHSIANGDFPLREGDDIDYKHVIPNRLKDSFPTVIVGFKHIFRIRPGRSSGRGSFDENQVREEGTSFQSSVAHLIDGAACFMKKKCVGLQEVGYLFTATLPLSGHGHLPS